MAITSLRVLFFDLDDTLYPAVETYRLGLRAAWKALRPYHAIAFPAFQRLYTRVRGDVKHRLGTHTSARNRMLYFKQMIETLERHSNPALALRLMNAYDTCWSQIDPRPARAVAKALSSRYRLGVLTDQLSLMQLQKLRRIDPDGRYFPILVTSEEVGVEKPNGRIFKEACRRARCSPRETMLIGNSWDKDIRGALKAGWRAAYLGSLAGRKLPAGVLHIRKLSDFPSTLEHFLST